LGRHFRDRVIIVMDQAEMVLKGAAGGLMRFDDA